jgi:hypothetical protein
VSIYTVNIMSFFIFYVSLLYYYIALYILLILYYIYRVFVNDPRKKIK